MVTFQEWNLKKFKFKNFDKAVKIAKSAYPQSYIDEVNEDLNDLKIFLLKIM